MKLDLLKSYWVVLLSPCLFSFVMLDSFMCLHARLLAEVKSCDVYVDNVYGQFNVEL